jgi:serine/threonine-protein kinase HipA
MCSAFSVHPVNKYQDAGGPSIKQIMGLLEGAGSPNVDRERFMRACAFNFVVAGIDAHGKNYSVLIEGGGRYRLAPLYDLMSALPYDAKTFDGLAMSVGGERKWQRIRPAHWWKVADECRYDPDRALAHVKETIAKLPAVAGAVLAGCRKDGLRLTVINKIAKALRERCAELEVRYA